jgi:acyl carrier protein
VSIDILKNEIKQLIIEAANLRNMKPEEIADDEPLFREGLGLDSIDLLEIVVRVEKKYGLKIQNDDAGRAALTNINALTDILHRHQG